MKYRIQEIQNSVVWNNFVEKYDYINVFSSWEWIEFEKSLYVDVFAYGIYDEKVLKGVFSFRVIDAKRGKYLILKQNIFLEWKDQEMVSEMINFLQKKCKELQCSFFRVCPPVLDSKELKVKFLNYGFKRATIHSIDAQVTNILDLTKSLEDISANMRKNTRYLIRKGEKLGVEVLNTDNGEYLDEFRKIYSETVKRHEWNASKFEYIEKQYKYFSSKGFSRIFVAKHKGKILAIAMFTKFREQVIYHHSGSVDDMQNIPAMYVLLWEAIKFYKELGMKEINFFGVCESNEKAHPWYGLSLFKRGFGGVERKFMHSYDYPISFKYYLVRIYEFFEKLSLKG